MKKLLWIDNIDESFLRIGKLWCEIFVGDMSVFITHSGISVNFYKEKEMKYKNIVKGKFLERPNRFISYCEIDNNIEKVHVKNTGKCKELLIPNCVVYLEESDNPNRKTKYSLISVQKNDRLINMDSQVPNKVVYEGLINNKIVLPGLDEEIIHIKPEKTYENSIYIADKYDWKRINCIENNQLRTIDDIHNEIYSIIEDEIL